MATKRKTRKFGEGGMLQDVSVDESIDKKPDVAITRGDAFKAARKAGKKTFWYGGKEYTTEMATGPKAEQKSTSGGPSTRGGARGKPTPAPDLEGGKRRAAAYSAQLARESEARSNPYGTPSMYKKGGKVKKYAAGGDIAPMSAMPSGKQLKENIEAQKQSEAERQARYKAVKAAAAAASPANKKASGGTIKKYARGGGIESKGKTRGRIC